MVSDSFSSKILCFTHRKDPQILVSIISSFLIFMLLIWSACLFPFRTTLLNCFVPCSPALCLTSVVCILRIAVLSTVLALARMYMLTHMCSLKSHINLLWRIHFDSYQMCCLTFLGIIFSPVCPAKMVSCLSIITNCSEVFGMSLIYNIFLFFVIMWVST